MKQDKEVKRWRYVRCKGMDQVGVAKFKYQLEMPGGVIVWVRGMWEKWVKDKLGNAHFNITLLHYLLYVLLFLHYEVLKWENLQCDLLW